MAISGPDTFDNDHAYNYLHVLLDKLNQEVKEFFQHLTIGHFSLREGDGVLMPCLDIQITLCERYSYLPALSKEEYSSLQKIYLTAYDKVANRIYGSDQFALERRKVVEQTFKKLEELAG